MENIFYCFRAKNNFSIQYTGIKFMYFVAIQREQKHVFFRINAFQSSKYIQLHFQRKFRRDISVLPTPNFWHEINRR